MVAKKRDVVRRLSKEQVNAIAQTTQEVASRGTERAKILEHESLYLTEKYELLKTENENLLTRLNRLELPVDCVVFRSALCYLGIAGCESDEELMQEYPSYIKLIIRKLSNLSRSNL